MTHLLKNTKWLLLILGDVTTLYLALWTTLQIRFGSPLQEHVWQQHALPFSLLFAAWIVIFYTFGLYDLTVTKNNINFYIALAKALTVAFVLAVIFFYLTPFFGIAPKTNLFLITAFVFIFIILWRQISNLILAHSFTSHNIFILGRNSQVEEFERYLSQNPQLGYRIIAVQEPSLQVLHDLQNHTDIHRILTAFDLKAYPEVVKTLFIYTQTFSFENFASFYEKTTGKIPLSQVDELWFLNNLKEREQVLYEAIKRGYDILIACALGIFTIILLPFIASAIKLTSPGPIFYSQQRVGKNGTIFSLYKFRSMVPNAEEHGAVWAQKKDERITLVGKILRKTFLDELPQTFNILKGDMSFIGPRPERPEFIQELENQIPFYSLRHIVKPGITGWAQVNFPYGNSIEGALEKLQYELYYIKNRSLLLDLKILLKTVNVIFRGGTQ